MTPQRAKVRRVCRFSQGMSSVTPSRNGCSAPSAAIASSTAFGVGKLDRAEGDAAFRGSRLRSSAPANTARASRFGRSRSGCRASPAAATSAAATSSAPTATAAASRGTKMRRAHRCASATSASMRAFVEPADHAAVEHRRRRGGAQAEAIDRLQRDALVGRRVAERDAELGFRARRQRIAAGGLAGFGAAQFQHMPARRLAGGNHDRR